MTSYFDAKAIELRELKHLLPDTWRFTEALRAIERVLVWDCTVASSAPDFPEELRTAIHCAVLRHGVDTLPVNAAPADFETEQDHLRRIRNLNEDLHDIFHALAQMTDFSDVPTSVIRRAFVTPREEERERMAPEYGGVTPEAYMAKTMAELADMERK